MNCSRCYRAITEIEREHCSWCCRDLCYDCWDQIGHCGHSEAEYWNHLGRNNLIRNGILQPGAPTLGEYRKTEWPKSKARPLRKGKQCPANSTGS